MTERRTLGWGAVRYVSSRLFMTVLFGVLLFAAAGRLNWVRAWLYMALVFIGEVVSAVVLAAANPEVLNRRGTTIRSDTKPFEKVILPVWLLSGYASGVVAGLDAGRFGRSALPLGLVPFGVSLLVVGYAVGIWAMAVNVFFEPTVRIQRERGHTVVTSGPYRIVRHPGYLGAILGTLGAPFVLGSVWMLAPLGGSILLLAIRTAFEDRTLESELPGYREYMRQTRYRLLPGIW